MLAFISDSQASRLQKVVKRCKSKAKPRKPWTKWTDDALLRKVLVQVCVIGKAKPGERLQHDRRITVKKLKGFQSDEGLQKYLHKLFAELEVRFSRGSTWKKDWKAEACTHNFRVLDRAGGPTQFFRKHIARCKTEEERRAALRAALKRYGIKSASDTLIELRLAENCMALDSRIFGILKKVGIKIRPDDIYKQIEKELKEKVAEPLGIRAALLDRILFQNYDDILNQL
jgi:hypothetical protein